MVTADGRALRASEEENGDLFWGLRGGGGNFGVATSFEYRLDAVGPEIVAGAVAWPASEASRVLEMWRRLVSEAPPELTCPVVLRLAPPAPWLAKEVHGKPIIVVLFCHSGSIEQGERLAAPLKALGSPVGDVLQRRSYVSQQSLLDATQPKGRRYYWKSEFLPQFEQDLVAKAAEHASRIVSPHSGIVLSRSTARSTACRKVTPQSVTATPAALSTSPPPGRRPSTTRQISSGRGRLGETSAGFRRAAPMSISLPRRKETSEPTPPIAATTGVWSRSSSDGTPAMYSGSIRTSSRGPPRADVGVAAQSTA